MIVISFFIILFDRVAMDPALFLSGEHHPSIKPDQSAQIAVMCFIDG
jgi:hypothetical protein